MEAHRTTIEMAEQWADEIEIGGPEDEEPGEFDASDYEWDRNSVNSTDTFQTTTSSVLQHDYENGRRFHHYRYGRYPIPNDDLEQNRETLKHVMTLEMSKWVAKILNVGMCTAGLAADHGAAVAS
jgi:hypothetical protein